MNPPLWTPDQDDMLAALVESGASARQIGATMGKTRNSIIGRVHRLGLKLKQAANSKGERTPRKPRVPGVPKSQPRKPVSVPHLAFVAAPKVDPSIPVVPRLVSLMNLQAHECRWVAEGVGENALFCGHDRQGTSSWCPHHRARVFVPAMELPG